jgi:hypothetical protein
VSAQGGGKMYKSEITFSGALLKVLDEPMVQQLKPRVK